MDNEEEELDDGFKMGGVSDDEFLLDDDGEIPEGIISPDEEESDDPENRYH